MNKSTVSAGSASKPALELISLARMAPEVARKNLRALLIANPDYFDRVTSNSFKAVLRIQQDTTYESIGYVTYNLSAEQLQATIHLNQQTGYSDGNCISKEHVRFYLSLDGGASWLDQGLSSIGVCDMPGPKPLQQRLSIGLSPVMTVCIPHPLPVVRTILSWNTPPPGETPEWIPVWGDVLNARIRFERTEAIELHPGLDGIGGPEAGFAAF
jgi:hypothetical protein